MALSTKNVQQVKNSKHQMFIFSSFHYYLTFSIIIWFVWWKNKMTNYNHKMFSWSWCSYMGKGHLLIILIYPNIVDPWTTQELGALISLHSWKYMCNFWLSKLNYSPSVSMGYWFQDPENAQIQECSSPLYKIA